MLRSLVMGDLFDARPVVVAVSSSQTRGVRKQTRAALDVIAGLGVAGDIHAGLEVRHLARIRKDPTQPNLRQVHLIHEELLNELSERGFWIGPGDMGENVLTRGIDLLALPTGSRLEIGPTVELEVTGLRNPCSALNQVAHGLLGAVVSKNAEGETVRKSGIMAIVIRGGTVRPGDRIVSHLPRGEYVPLRPVLRPVVTDHLLWTVHAVSVDVPDDPAQRQD